jgi:hypothetical protein
MQVKGWAHLCYLPPFDDQGNYESFQGHVIDGATKMVYGIKGHWMDYDDPEKNDCMDPQAFYRLILSDYSAQNNIRSLVIRREMNNDMANLETDPLDDAPFDQADLSFRFEPTSLLVDEKAYQHCEKYIPALIREQQQGHIEERDTDGRTVNSGEDWLVNLGTIVFDDSSA